MISAFALLGLALLELVLAGLALLLGSAEGAWWLAASAVLAAVLGLGVRVASGSWTGPLGGDR
jgi:hypothetical protein